MRALAVLFALSLSACTTVGVAIPEDEVITDPQPEPEPEPDPVSPYAGDWGATLLLLADFGRGPMELCVADLELEVDDEGSLAGDGFCEITFGGGGQGQSGYDVTVSGGIDDDGTLDATTAWAPVGRGIAPIDDVPLTGAATDGAGEASGVTVINVGFPVDAEVELSIGR